MRHMAEGKLIMKMGFFHFNSPSAAEKKFHLICPPSSTDFRAFFNEREKCPKIAGKRASDSTRLDSEGKCETRGFAELENVERKSFSVCDVLVCCGNEQLEVDSGWNRSLYGDDERLRWKFDGETCSLSWF